MNVIGQRLKVLSSKDPTKIGKMGIVLLDTAGTLLIESDGRTLRIEKPGAAFQLLETGRVLTGEDISGRLQDRLGRQAA